MTGDGDQNFSSAAYWQERYKAGGTSGSGSYGRLAVYKAHFINELVHRQQIKSVIEFGCGDGNQASLFTIPKYTGLDVSKESVTQCRMKFADVMTWSFHQIGTYAIRKNHQLSMSLDVLYHLVEDDVFEKYMKHLFASASGYVLIYSSDHDDVSGATHVRHRAYSNWVSENIDDWTEIETFAHPYPRNEKSNPRHTALAFFRLYGRKDVS